MNYRLFTLFPLLLVACTPMQQAHREAAQINADKLASAHIKHVEYLQRHFAQLQNTLARSVRAAWHAEVECDCCEDEALLLPVTPLPTAEFAELKALLKQARPIEPLPAEKLYIDCHYVVDEHGEVVPGINIHPSHLVPQGGIFANLCFYDASGKVIDSWSLDRFGKASAMPQYNNMDDYARPWFILPDAALHRLISLPTGSAFQNKVTRVINQTHTIRSRKN